jgi:hypothetical protein
MEQMTSSRKGHRWKYSQYRDRPNIYIGRFLGTFAIIASAVEELFANKFNLDAFSALLLQQNMDLCKKLSLLRFAFDRQGISFGKTLSQVHNCS